MSPKWLPSWGKPREKAANRAVEGDSASTPAPEVEAASSVPAPAEAASAPLTEEGVTEALKEVFDPELAIDVVSLGLVYGADIEGRSVRVRMTLTSPGCPIGPMIQAMATAAVKRAYPDLESVRVDLVWTPPWDPYTMASEEAKDSLGIW